MNKTIDTVTTLANAMKVPLEVLSCGEYDQRMRDTLDELDANHTCQIYSHPADVMREVSKKVGPDDLLVVTTAGSELLFRPSLGRIPEELAETTDSSMVVVHYP